ncbi:DUF305 domain-containing protein [Pararhodobacter oceanensis]|uniref:DUF305 domain-containing protein n=1 Tax=Pararhodobacter oceanensis TaxID=2172121 RepID=A0A2T8HPT2_9RHOB|nr:DUF305 domain-containing protein [Pararhodobacter oceanensis]PVH27451.1 DUF305 domain-containing protein [Pararhodobacter oceanensis]
MTYTRFFLMIASSTLVMFGLMYLNTYLLSHVFWSETRAYMALVMGAAMAIVMLGFMFKMYPSPSANIAILAASAVIFGGALWLVRAQVTVEDRSYLRAMIPHHSIAIMTSTRANLSDPRVRDLADAIIYAQDREIAEMRYLIDRVQPAPAPQPAPEAAQVESLQEAISTPQLSTLAPQFITGADLQQAFPQSATCGFHYTPDSDPVLAIGTETGETSAIVKLSGDLVRLQAENPMRFTTDGAEIALTARDDGPLESAGEAVLTMNLDGGGRRGYSGFYRCAG